MECVLNISEWLGGLYLCCTLIRNICGATPHSHYIQLRFFRYFRQSLGLHMQVLDIGPARQNSGKKAEETVVDVRCVDASGQEALICAWLHWLL